MNFKHPIPPLRDLPPGRLAQRREHPLSEIVAEKGLQPPPAPLGRLDWPRIIPHRAISVFAAALAAGRCGSSVLLLVESVAAVEAPRDVVRLSLRAGRGRVGGEVASGGDEWQAGFVRAA